MTSLHEHMAYLLLGSNLGDRGALIARAIEALEQRAGTVVIRSALYETAPWGTADQPAYLNQAVGIHTRLSPDNLLTVLLDIEAVLGRRRLKRWESRLIDIDILYYDQLVMTTERLEIPHPRLHERNFVLHPMAEIAPHFVHPVLGNTQAALLALSTDTSEVTRYTPSLFSR